MLQVEAQLVWYKTASFQIVLIAYFIKIKLPMVMVALFIQTAQKLLSLTMVSLVKTAKNNRYL
jgi:hypothetical protein